MKDFLATAALMLIMLSGVLQFQGVARAMSGRFTQRSVFSKVNYKIHYDASQLQVTYGENFRMNLWTQVESGSLGQVLWSVKAGGLPEGLTLISTGPQSAVISGPVRFLGQWCLELAAKAQYSSTQVEENFCLQSIEKAGAPKMAPSPKFPAGGTGLRKIPSGVSPGMT